MCQLNLRGLGAGLLCLLGLSAQGGVYTFTSSPSTAIPDPGYWTGTISADDLVIPSGYTIKDVDVTINVSGGWNGDLVAKLEYTGGGYVYLLNRVGRDEWRTAGYETAGFSNVTLDDTGTKGNIHVYGGDIDKPPVPSGSYQPDGRVAGPDDVYTSTPPTTTLGVFNEKSANGTWTITFLDVSAGDQSTLASWSLRIEAVPEPITTALIIFGVVFGSFRCVRYLRARKACPA